MVMSMRLTSACSMMATPPWTRSRAYANRFLVRPLTRAQALKSYFQPRLVHHGEHASQSIIFLADEVTDGTAIIAIRHDTGRTAVNP